MPDAAITTTEHKQASARPISRKVAAAIEAMVWQGLPRRDAAQVAGLEEHSLYKALRLPPVKAEYLAQCEILRTSGRARRIHRLEEISEATSNLNASVQAIRTLDAPDNANNPMGSGRSAMVTMPGLVIQIVQAVDPQPATLRHEAANPLISHGSDILPENVDR